MKTPRRLSRTRLSEAPAPAATDRSHGAYLKTVLPNGLRVVSEEIPHVRSVSIGVWIDSGSRDESSATNGISHFIEHMVFKGTTSRSVRDLAQSLESVGGYLNAFTGKEHTCYYARILDENAPLAADVLADMVLHPTFPEKELEKEKGVVIDELRHSEDDPDDIIHDYFDKALYGDHPLGRPVIGTEENLRSFTRKDLFAFRQERYVPSRMVVAAAGKISHAQLLDMVAKHFDFGKRPAADAAARTTPKPRHAATQKFEKSIQQAHICMGTTAYEIRSRHRYPLMVLNTLLGEGMSSRLFQNIREKYGFAYTVYSFANLMSDAGSFGAYVGTDKQHIHKSIELVWSELQKLVKKPVSRAELQRTKAQLKGSMMLGLESIPSRMIRLGSSELYFGELTSLDTITRKIDAVTQDDIQTVAADLFREDRFSAIIFVPNGRHAAAGARIDA